MARQRPRTLCDVDGVVCNFVQTFLAAVEAATGIQKKQEEIKTFMVEESLGLNDKQSKAVWELMNSVGIAARMNALPGAVQGIKELAKVSDVHFLTAPIDSSPTWDYDRRHWLTEQFGEELGKKRVIFTASKDAVAGDLFIDDKPENLKEWKKAWPHGICILWDQPYNQGHPDLPRTSNWTTVVQVAKEMALTPTFAGRRT